MPLLNRWLGTFTIADQLEILFEHITIPYQHFERKKIPPKKCHRVVSVVPGSFISFFLQEVGGG